MTIQKKSLLSSLNTTKKAIVASNSAEESAKVAVGGAKVGRQTVGRQTVGRQTVGRQTVGRQTVGRQTVGRVAQN